MADPLMAGKLTTLLVWLVFSLRREPHTHHGDPQTGGRHFWGKSLPDQGDWCLLTSFLELTFRNFILLGTPAYAAGKNCSE